MKKKIIISAVLAVLTMSTALLSIFFLHDINAKLYIVVTTLGNLPFIVASGIMASLIPNKIKFLRYIIYAYLAVFAAGLAAVALLALFGEIKVI